MKRVIINVTPTATGWAVKGAQPGRPVEFFVKHMAVGWAAGCGRALWLAGKQAQVRVWRKDGRIHFERTYGRDPRRSKG